MCTVLLRAITSRHLSHHLQSLDGLYGAGTYFADQSCKALQYSPQKAETWTDSLTGRSVTKKTKIVLISRVLLGDPFYAEKANRKKHQKRRRPPDHEGRIGLLYDSMVVNIDVGSKQMHREIMIYDRAQAYPE